jgi:hypothetical protein
MASNEKNLCNVLRDTWRALLELVNYNSSYLRRILSSIQALINRVKNTILRRIANVIRDIRDIVSNFLGLQTIDNNLARNEFCKVLYACKPALEKIMPLISQELYNQIFGPESIKTIDLAKYGLPQINFASKFELFEYVACRLSLRGLLDNVTETLIQTLLAFIQKFEKYLDINWWLNNTAFGRVLKRLINEYEQLFNNTVKPFIDELEKYMNCAFALCDFSKSTDNFLSDFSSKYKIERSQNVNLQTEWVLSKEELYGDLTTSMGDIKKEIASFQTSMVTPIENSDVNFHYKKDNEKSNNETITDSQPYNKLEKSQLENNKDRKNILSPSISSKTSLTRKPVSTKSPTST